MQEDEAAVRADWIGYRRLWHFECVGRLSSIHRAAQECSLSQPAVTQSIAKLESQLGVSLLQRGTSGSYLTELGTILHSRSTRFFAQVEKAVAELVGSARASVASMITRRLTRSQIRSILPLANNHISFADAAKSYGLSATSLQRALQDFEHSLGKQLYRRSASGLAGTPEGIAFGQKIKLALQEIGICSIRGGRRLAL
jgi:DNA-binding transcriptional LysR family regulator